MVTQLRGFRGYSRNLCLIIIGLIGASDAAHASSVMLSANGLTFGNEIQGTTSGAQTVTVSNTDPVNALTVTGVVASRDYAETDNCIGTVAAGGSCTINVTFTPTITGPDSGSVTITDSDGSSPQIISLSGTGVLAVALSPTALTYPNQAVNATSPTQMVILTNNESITLKIAAIAASGDFGTPSTNCGPAVAGGASCTINVTFTPTAAGARNGTLALTDDANTSPQSAPLTGTGVVPVVLSPSSVTFGNQVTNTTSAAQTVTITNNQSIVLNISSVATSGDFAISANTCGASIAGGANCTVSVIFTPIVTGTRNGTLTIADDANTSPQLISFSGTGIVAMTVSPASLTFGSTRVTNSSKSQTVTLTNPGSTQVQISGVTIAGDFGFNSTCSPGLGLGPNKSSTLH